MSLVLKLAPSERLFVNGAVLTNGSRRTQLIVENEAQILRERDILPVEETPTPVRNAYFAAQNVVLALQLQLGSTEPFRERVAQLRGIFVKAEHLALLDDAEVHLTRGNAYRALALLRDLMTYESALLAVPMPERFQRAPQAAPAAPLAPPPRHRAEAGAIMQ